MEYRKMEKLGISPSMLGFGCMRFPTLSNGEIDEEKAEQMLDRAITAGVTYIDTAYPYHNGKSEPFVGRVLKKYDRSKLYLATKLPVWLVKETSDVERYFNEQLERLQTDYIDFYLMHAMNKNHWETMKSLGAVEILERLKKEGKIRYLGFSFHDSYETFETMLNEKDWDFCQIQFNYMDTEIQAGLKGYRLAEERKVPIIVMEPIKGGSLTTFADDIVQIFQEQRQGASLASLALRYVGTFPNVKVILSGMSAMDQLEDNLATFDSFEPLSEKEQQVVANVVKEVKARVKNGCTGCRYCMPCPFGIEIPRNFSIWNEYAMYHNKRNVNWRYFQEMNEKVRADQCKKCGKCETLCPQKISIRDDLARMAKEMEGLRL